MLPDRTRTQGKSVVWEYPGATIRWDPASRGKLPPSRAHGLGDPGPAPDPEEARRAMSRRIAKGGDAQWVDGLRRWLEDPAADGVVAPLVEAALAGHAVGGDLHAWIAHGGLAFAVAPFVAYLARDRRVSGAPVHAMTMARQLREALVQADEATYRAALAAARAVAPPGLSERAALAAAFAWEPDLVHPAVDEIVAAGGRPFPLATLVGGFVTDPRLAERLAEATCRHPHRAPALVALAHLGPEVVRPFRIQLLRRWSDNAVKEEVRALTKLASPEAARLLVPLAACRPFTKSVASYVKRHAEIARPVIEATRAGDDEEALDLAQAQDIGSSLDALLQPIAPVAPAAPPDDAWPEGTPEVLRAPPWTRARPKPPTVPLALLELPERWEGGPAPSRRGRPIAELEAARARADAGAPGTLYVSALHADDPDRALEIWNEGRPERYAGTAYDARELFAFCARHREAALDGLLRFAEGKLGTAAGALQGYDSARVALPVARRLAQRKDGEAWILRYPRTAAVGLIPPALGRAKKDRAAAALGLRLLLDAGRRAVVDEVADEYGVREALAEALADDTPRRLPATAPFVVLERLPRVRLASGEELPAAATDVVVRLLQLSGAVDHSGLHEVREACDPASLDALAHALFEQWLAHGAAPKHDWAIASLGRLCLDARIEELLPLLGRWQQKGSAQRAGKLLDAIASMGTEVALMHLDRIRRRDRYRKLRGRADAAIERVARRLGLSPEQLEDRTAPALGLDERGATELDLGGRTLTVVFDEALRPQLLGPDGRRRKSFPKAGSSDDPAEHAAAKRRYSALKKAAKLVADQQVARLERMMVRERRVSASELRRFFVEHPLVRHLAERVIWTGDGAAAGGFRVAEDGTLADVDDEALELPDDATVGVAHPLHLDAEARDTWADLLADYELVQPFPQLGRRTFSTSPEELEGREVPWELVAKLARDDWAATTHDGLRDTDFTRSVFGIPVSLSLSPGLLRGNPVGSGSQRILAARAGLGDDASPIARSEAMRAFALLLEASA